MFMENTAFWTMALVVIAVGAALFSNLTGESRDRRKRRKNYGRVVSRARRPIVTLSVNTR
jgi:hypothetical protein